MIGKRGKRAAQLRRLLSSIAIGLVVAALLCGVWAAGYTQSSQVHRSYEHQLERTNYAQQWDIYRLQVKLYSLGQDYSVDDPNYHPGDDTRLGA
jgi:hypothetical protein